VLAPAHARYRKALGERRDWAARALVDGLPPDVGGHASGGTWAAFVAVTTRRASANAPPRGGRSATASGDERAGTKRRDPFRAPASRTGSSGDALGDRRDQGRARIQHTIRPTPATTRRSSANAPQRAGASRWKALMS